MASKSGMPHRHTRYVELPPVETAAPAVEPLRPMEPITKQQSYEELVKKRPDLGDFLRRQGLKPGSRFLQFEF